MSTKRRALGRGLDSLIKPATTDVRTLPVRDLRPNPRQPRRDFDEAALGELAESIRTQGVVQPIIVAPDGAGGYSIVAGERRWRAAQLAGLEQVPVAVRAVGDERQRLELALVENLQRADLNAMEEADAYQALQHEFGLSQEEIAARVGKARPTIANSLRLLNLPDGVQSFLRSGRLAAGQARPLLSLGKPAAQLALAERAVRERLSSREIEALVAQATGRAAQPGKRRRTPVDVHSAAAAERLTRRLHTKVDIRRRRDGGGTLQIHFFSEEDLMRLYDRLVAGGEEE